MEQSLRTLINLYFFQWYITKRHISTIHQSRPLKSSNKIILALPGNKMSTLEIVPNQADAKEQAQQSVSNNQQLFFSLVEKIGSFGRYQKVTIILWAALIFFCAQLLFSTPFLFYQDPYDCSSLSPDVDCKDYVCSLDPSQRLPYIPTPTINSLANDLGDYRCPSQRSNLDNIIAAMFFGIVLGFFLQTLFGQLVSRKMLMLINFTCYLIGIIIVLLFYKNQVVLAGGLMITVLGISNCYIVCFMFLIQTVEARARQKYTVLIQALYGAGICMNIVWYWVINDWWTIFFVCYLIPAVIVLICLCVLVVDTPMSLLLRNTKEKALEKLNFMARINGNQDSLKLEDIQSILSNYQQSASQVTVQKISVIQIFKYRSIRYKTILLILLQCTITFEFYAPSLMLSSFHFNIYINGIAIGISQILANFSASYFVSRFKRRYTGFSCFASTFICSTILIFVWDQNGKEASLTADIIILLLIFIFQFSITLQSSIFYVYLNEVYPTQARMIAVSIIGLTGGLQTTLTSKIISQCMSASFPVMIIFATLSGICILILRFLPETFKTAPKEMIDQLQKNQYDRNTKSDDGLKKSLIVD